MAARTYHEWVEDNVHEDGASCVSGYRAKLSFFFMEAARGVRSTCLQIVVPSLFNNEENLDYFGPFPNVSFYGADEMSEGERRDFLAWYMKKKSEDFDNRFALETYCQDHVTVLRHFVQSV